LKKPFGFRVSDRPAVFYAGAISSASTERYGRVVGR
jgi:hypothetical protein